MARANDKIDRQLLALLQANARESTTSLSTKLGIARTTIQERITRLEANGTITGYSAILNHDPFKDYSQAVLLISVVQKSLKAAVARIAQFPEIKVCQVINGEFDLWCRVAVPHVEDLGAVMEEIGEIAGVERVRSWIVLSTCFDRGDRDIGSRVGRMALSDGEAG